MNRTTLGIAGGCVVAALTGYLLARSDHDDAKGRTGAWFDRNSPAADGTNTPDPLAPGSASKQRTAAQLKAFKDDLRARFERSPSAERDWVLREQAAALLATLSTSELEAFAREFAPSGEGPFIRHESDAGTTLMREIFRQWGLKDPAAASVGLADTGWWDAGTMAFGDWLRRDPAAASAWVNAGDFPPGSEQIVAALQRELLNRQVATDFPAAVTTLGKLDPEAQQKTLLNWSRRLALDPESRAELLALVASRGDPDFAKKCYQALVAEMSRKSPSDAAEFVEASGLPEEQKDGLHDEVLGAWATQNPQEAFARWAELKEEKAPVPLLRAMDRWSSNSPGAEEAIEWVKALHPGAARDQFKTHLVSSMSDGERYAQAAELSATLDDPVERLRQMKSVKRQWEEKFPQHAKQWYDKLPQEQRDALETVLK